MSHNFDLACLQMKKMKEENHAVHLAAFWFAMLSHQYEFCWTRPWKPSKILAWFLTDILMQSVSTTEVKQTSQVAIVPSACLQPG